jgi:cytoskeleton protein RodZ
LLKQSEHGLRAARELQQLTVDDVANVLHLSREHIVALETGDFARLGPQVFVRGYLRSYARLLGLAEQSVLADFPLGDMEPEEFQTMSVQAELKPGFYIRAWMIWALLGLILLVAALIFVASTSDADNDRAAAGNDVVVEQSVAPVDDSAVGKKVTDSNTGRPRFTIVEPGPESTVSALPRVAVVTADSATESETETATATATATATETERVPDSLPVAGQTESAALSTAPVVAGPLPVAASAAGKVNLTLSFSDECWVEIADSQRSLLYGLEKRGAVVNLDGVPPFKLFFGNREAVQITLAGKPFAMPVSASDSGNTARFTIKAEQL